MPCDEPANHCVDPHWLRREDALSRQRVWALPPVLLLFHTGTFQYLAAYLCVHGCPGRRRSVPPPGTPWPASVPRFRADAWSLPDEPLLGFCGDCSGTSSLMGSDE